MKMIMKKIRNNLIKVLAVPVLVIILGATIYAEDMCRVVSLVGIDGMLEDYCTKVINGSLVKQSSEAFLGLPEKTTDASGAAVDEDDKDNDGHVDLNLNYSRLGIADKVDTYLNIRNKPSKKGKVVGKLTKNAGCHIYKIEKGWAKIVSGKVTGWIKSSYITRDAKAEELAKSVGREVVEIQTDSLRVRALPTMTSPVYSVVSEGEEFTIKKSDLTMDFVQKVIKKQKISDDAMKKAGGIESISQSLSQFVCIYVDNDYAFVAKEYVKEQYALKRAVKVKKVSAKHGVSSSQASIAEVAKKYLGNRYVWGGESLEHGVDCSGFVMCLYRKFGHYLPHSAAAQAGCTRRVKGSPKPGDLFFYSNGYRINHVAMYIGGGMVIHASNHRDGIKISNAYYRHPVKIGRIFK